MGFIQQADLKRQKLVMPSAMVGMEAKGND